MNIKALTDDVTTIGHIVARNYRTADVFKKYGIDFCCKGGRLLEEVCKEKNLNLATIENELIEKMAVVTPVIEDVYQSMQLDELTTHIENVHHNYVRDNITVLMGYLHKINSVHGPKHPELNEIYQLFEDCGHELLQHMIKEETILFPAIRKIVSATKNGTKNIKPFFFGSLSNPIGMMENEHTKEGERFFKIAELSSGFTAPEDGCATYLVAFQKLKEFQNDLFQHIHLENNILFPGALKMEEALSRD